MRVMARIASPGPAVIAADGEAPGCWGAIRTDPAHLEGAISGVVNGGTVDLRVDHPGRLAGPRAGRLDGERLA